MSFALMIVGAVVVFGLLMLFFPRTSYAIALAILVCSCPAFANSVSNECYGFIVLLFIMFVIIGLALDLRSKKWKDFVAGFRKAFTTQPKP
jgi:hypothetical protein